MQGWLSRAVFVDRKANEIKEARSFTLSRVEGLWDFCLLRLLGGADITEKWEAKVCPFLFCATTPAQESTMTMISAITHGQMISTSIFPDLHFRPMEANSYLTYEYHTRISGLTC